MTQTKTPAPRAARTSVAKAASPRTAAAKAKPAVAKATAKPAAKPAAKPVAAVVPVAAAAKSRAQPKGDSFKIRMLVDQVVKTTGAKKKGVKDVVEATLSRIGEALARGDELNLPGFGKVRVVKSDARDGTAIMTLKLRQGTGKPGQKGLAASGDDD